MDYMQEYEYYKTAWEKSVADKTKQINERVAVLEAEIEILNQKIEKTSKALLFYAYDDNWSDNGLLARKTLKEIE